MCRLPGGPPPGEQQDKTVDGQPIEHIFFPPWQVYTEHLKPTRPVLLFRRMHDRLSMENDQFWKKTMGEELAVAENVTQQDSDSEDDDDSSDPHMSE